MGRVAKLGMRTYLSKTYDDDDSSSGGERELCESSRADPKIGGGRSAVVVRSRNDLDRFWESELNLVVVVGDRTKFR